MDQFLAKLKIAGFKGHVDTTDKTLELYSHDASMFELRPTVVVTPQNSQDVQILVKQAGAAKKAMPQLSLTARSAGTDMSGGAINDSAIVDFSRGFTKIKEITSTSAHVEPGVFYRDFEPKTFEHDALLPSFPASRELCTVGGMVNNNSGGEKSLEFGKTENFVTELQVIFADGKEYTVKPLDRRQLVAKMSQKSYEGKLYKQTFELIEKNYDAIKAAKPHVTKNSTGYNLWDVWDRQTGIFDLTKLIVGAQGTLGFVTDIHFKLVPTTKFSGVLVCFMKTQDQLGEIINTVMDHSPATFESFDNYTLELSIKFFFYFRKTLGYKKLAKLAIQLLPDLFLLARGIPKLILLIEFTAQTQQEVDDKLDAMRTSLKPFKLEATEDDNTEAKAWKFRIMRRESFNLLRKKVKDKHTAPFIDDLVVPTEHLPEFLPRLRKIIDKYKLLATVAGHMGDGNFHVIPLMKLDDPKERAKILPCMKEVNELVLKYNGSLSGEHNDGLIRGPWLGQMYGPKVLKIFKETKHIFDPEDLFNPHKKADANWDYSFSHIRKSF
ncbi:MAG: FAD-binding oxidoreductase [Candidatus Saccharimonadales bacterium]